MHKVRIASLWHLSSLERSVLREVVKEHETATGGQWVRFGYVDFARVYAAQHVASFLGGPPEGTYPD